MIQFNLNRFGKLARWSLTIDRSFYAKNFLQVFVVCVLVFLVFTTVFPQTHVIRVSQSYIPCGVASIIMLMVTLITGPAWMFSSEKGKHDRQMLLMLPASNLEKYLMRYSTWLILLPLYIVAFLSADVIQYLVNVLMGHDYTMLVTSKIVEMTNASWTASKPWVMNIMIVICLWAHSVYALGGTFFRSQKFAWIFTTIALIAFQLLWMWFIPSMEVNEDTSMFHLVIADAVYVAWILLNFWLSYRLFCRQQVVGRFVNV